MDIEVIKKIIKNHEAKHTDFIQKAETAERYYRNENDILTAPATKAVEEESNPLRNADNRIPRNFHGLLVNQKASYLFTASPLYDVDGNKELNERIADVLGDEYNKTAKDLCINASNAGVAWLHYWVDADGQFEYAAVDPKQVIPIWTKDLKRKLSGVLRVYKQIDEETGDTYKVYEFWNDVECHAFRRKEDGTLDDLQEYQEFAVYSDNVANISSWMPHDYGMVPFIPFFNNNIPNNDLVNIKKYIDSYDKVFSGFVNDLEDIQEIIFVLSGYGGTDLQDFLSKLKLFKTVKADDDGENIHAGIETLTIDIPVEAREKMLDLARKAIFEQGQGLDPQPEAYGNASGVALKYLYSLLELKAGLMETEFKLSFGELVRAICRYLKADCKKITQTWTRTAIANDAELATIAASSAGTISQLTIIKNHPWVEDAEAEMKQIEKEQTAAEEQMQTKETEMFPDEEEDDSGGDK